MSLAEATARVAGLLREADTERFGASLTAPPSKRPALWALYALNLQAAAAPYASGTPMLGQIRLQYWLDRLDDLGAGRAVDRHDVLELLNAHWGERAVDLRPVVAARMRDCEMRPFDGSADLLRYIDDSAGAVMWHAARYLADDVPAEAVADQARGVGSAAWLLAQPKLQRQGRGLRDAKPGQLAQLAHDGMAALDRATAARRHVPRAAAPALYGGVARWVLGQVAQRPSTGVKVAPLRRQLKLALFSIAGRW